MFTPLTILCLMLSGMLLGLPLYRSLEWASRKIEEHRIYGRNRLRIRLYHQKARP